MFSVSDRDSFFIEQKCPDRKRENSRFRSGHFFNREKCPERERLNFQRFRSGHFFNRNKKVSRSETRNVAFPIGTLSIIEKSVPIGNAKIRVSDRDTFLVETETMLVFIFDSKSVPIGNANVRVSERDTFLIEAEHHVGFHFR